MNTPLDVQDQLPLTETTFFILLSMASDSRHGYAIMKDVAELSDNRIRLSAGTLYGALARLLEQAWIERLDSDEPDESGRPRKEYKLTGFGRRILTAETRRLRSLVTLAWQRSIGEHL
jgi:DNA-binding PadR family transcriptional regulator